MKKKILSVCLIVVALSAAGFLIFREQPGMIRVGDRSFRIEKAVTPKERERGLGERDALCSGCGMLFPFSGKEKPGFWMKGMRFGLDILWIAGGEVVHIDREIPADSEEIFFPPVPIEGVLEVGSGAAAGIEEGAGASLD